MNLQHCFKFWFKAGVQHFKAYSSSGGKLDMKMDNFKCTGCNFCLSIIIMK